MEDVFKKINRSGFIEFIFMSSGLLFDKASSVVKVFFYRMRGYTLDYSIMLGNNTVLFQSRRDAIKINKNVFIGDGVRIKAGFKGKIIIGEGTYIHDYSFIFAHNRLSIGSHTLIAPQVFITDFDHKYPHDKYKHLMNSEKGYENKKVTIGSHVWIGTHSVILPGVEIGDNVVIGAGSVVTKSISANSIAVGNPARVIKNRT